MKSFQNYSLEFMLILATFWMGLLSFIYEFFGVPLTTTENVVLINVFNAKALAFTPTALMSSYNHLMMVIAPLLVVIGLYGLLKPDLYARKYFMVIQMFFWFGQTLGLIALGFYPLAASFTSLYFGAAFYLVLIKFWK